MVLASTLVFRLILSISLFMAREVSHWRKRRRPSPCPTSLFSGFKVDASQSRADLLALGLAVTNILSGLVWLSIRPKTISKVDPNGVDCYWIAPHFPASVVSELQCCIFQTGVAAKSSKNDEVATVDATKFVQGALYGGLLRSGTQSYLANLSLYPGKAELPFLPLNTQAVILQPLGDKGVAIIGGDTIRGFTTADQVLFRLPYAVTLLNIILIVENDIRVQV
ncbi:hypothetical protein KSS87_002386 [Heliosperma pusillum]|nr:hypothetical protein KSS87_002386 [Heliosperma pusillum]